MKEDGVTPRFADGTVIEAYTSAVFVKAKMTGTIFGGTPASENEITQNARYSGAGHLLFVLKPCNLLLQSIYMAITSSANKAIRSSEKKRVFNIRRKGALHDAVKSLKKALAAKDVGGAEKLLPAAYQAIDKAAKRGVIKGNTADRKKSRLAAAIKRAK